MSVNASTMSPVKPVDDKMVEEAATFDHLDQQKLTRKVLFKLDARYEWIDSNCFDLASDSSDADRMSAQDPSRSLGALPMFVPGPD